MTTGWTPLPWDSEFFGFPIGKVDLDGADEAQVAAVEADARSQGIVCLYGTADPIDHNLVYRVQTQGWRFVEAATSFDLHPRDPVIPCPPGVTVRRGTEADLPAIAELVDDLAEWSRFAMDPRFGLDAALRLQRAWIRRAATCTTDAFALMLAEDTEGIVAFIGRVGEPHPSVDSVGTFARGSGAARYLIQDARDWAGDQPLMAGPIAARNVPCLRYVSHCHYRVSKVRYVYHRWLDEDGVQ